MHIFVDFTNIYKYIQDYGGLYHTDKGLQITLKVTSHFFSTFILNTYVLKYCKFNREKYMTVSKTYYRILQDIKYSQRI